ncbi:MAG TPA: ABC transporter substrate-binding protein [Xanthobacteraceae bacterium]|nr:ABC transporter substrate-binding protein [Xanthobacteraceae bacterium]
MDHSRRRLLQVALGASAAAAIPGFRQAKAQAMTVRLAKQFGISYLPLTIMEQKKLLEEHGKRLGLELTTDWVKFTSGAPMNEAIISGNLDFASGGVGPLLTIWGKTRGNIGVKGVSAINAMPLFLNTINPNVKTIKDFTDKDRIALPAVRVSIQAVTLQMAAEKEFGPGQQNKLDHLTVSLGHPDGMAQMMSGRSEITGHFTSAPFQYQELDDSRVRKVLDSYDVLGGPHTFNSIWTSAKFYNENRKVVQAFLAALEDAMGQIKADPAAAAQLWVKAENSKLPPAYAERIIRAPENEWTMVPKKIMSYADYMSRAGMLSQKPASWSDVYFEDIHKLPGS